MGILKIEEIQRRQKGFLLLRRILRFIQELFDFGFQYRHDYNQLNGEEKFDEIVGPEGKLGIVLQKEAKWMEERGNRPDQLILGSFTSASLQMAMGQEEAFLRKNQAYLQFYTE